MKDEYIIINRTALEKRMEELEKNKLNVLLGSDIEISILKQILSQSTPLIPENINKILENNVGEQCYGKN